MGYIQGRYTFTEAGYPALRHLPDELRANFVLSHVIAHTLKSIGSIATLAEAADHSGEAPAAEALREPVLKLVMNSLRLAREIGLTADDVIGGIPALMKPH